MFKNFTQDSFVALLNAIDQTTDAQSDLQKASQILVGDLNNPPLMLRAVVGLQMINIFQNVKVKLS